MQLARERLRKQEKTAEEAGISIGSIIESEHEADLFRGCRVRYGKQLCKQELV